VSTLARRAYRRPVMEDDIAPLMSLFEAGRKDGGFDAGIRRAIQGILVDPDFLFRIERVPATAASRGRLPRITGLELASRLSFFLWSSIPDDELLNVAVQGRLNDPAVLDQQARRMLHDARSTALVENFFGEWLQIRNVQARKPDAVQFPEFDDNLRMAFQQETNLFLGSQLQEDRSMLDLLRADYTYLNERLAKHYGIQGVYGSDFRRVHLTDPRRQGLLGQGSLLMVTSYDARTSPVLRGRFLLDNFFGAPPPPPLPNVPALKENDDEGKPTSVRARLEQHRKNPVCATCHSRMDPLGFALENFDAVGKWRTDDAGVPVDSSGTLTDGTRITGVADLRNVLMKQPEVFVTAVTERLLSYALGRGLSYKDSPAIRRMIRQSASSDYRWSSLIVELVKSKPFQLRREVL
jgi:hypothetical protein